VRIVNIDPSRGWEARARKTRSNGDVVVTKLRQIHGMGGREAHMPVMWLVP
jgi:hypothetical protein